MGGGGVGGGAAQGRGTSWSSFLNPYSDVPPLKIPPQQEWNQHIVIYVPVTPL